MKQYLALFILALLAAGFGAGAQSLDDRYVQIFTLIQEGDSLAEDHAPEALAKYSEAQTALQTLQKDNPGWNAHVVAFRLQYVTNKIHALSAKMPKPEIAPAAGTNSPAPVAATNAAPASPASLTENPALKTTPLAPVDLEPQVNSLKDQVRQLQSDKQLLEAKLKEAFATRPAEADPRDLTRAQERIRSLEKENELLMVTADKGKVGVPAEDPKALEQSQQALAEANRQLATQKELVANLTRDNEALKAHARNPVAAATLLATLHAENELLKKQVADLQLAPHPADKSADAARQLAQTQAELAALQSDKEVLRLEKEALQNRVNKLTASAAKTAVVPVPVPTVPVQASPADASRIKALEAERDDLQKKLASATKSASSRKEKTSNSRVEELENQLAVMQVKIDAYEARAVPYTPEELALFQKTSPASAEAAAAPAKRSIRELSPATASLVVEARRYYQDKQFDKAENAYREALKDDQKNVPVLANLASVQLEDEHLDAADGTLKEALAVAPEDAYALSVLGRLRFRQGKYDDAVAALGHAAKVEPDNAEVQNFLGLALSEKGQRGPAEAALRKAVQIDPNYATAHNNLAVVYITQKPPAVELARWHYQKALTMGAPHNPKLEELLKGNK
jgi:tetratricopeptide (TPR) repeat protein